MVNLYFLTNNCHLLIGYILPLYFAFAIIKCHVCCLSCIMELIQIEFQHSNMYSLLQLLQLWWFNCVTGTIAPSYVLTSFLHVEQYYAQNLPEVNTVPVVIKCGVPCTSGCYKQDSMLL